ncbi:hypothetical protein pb186bvf_020799 [Paramecium bursaria]
MVNMLSISKKLKLFLFSGSSLKDINQIQLKRKRKLMDQDQLKFLSQAI